MKLSAGSGYTYLTKQVARNDERKTGGQLLADYYSEKGERPGQWMGRGLAGLGDSNGISVGETVTEQQMKDLFGSGYHPNANAVIADAPAHMGPDPAPVPREALLGTPFRDPDPAPSDFIVLVSRAQNAWLSAHGHPRGEDIPDEVKAQIRTDVATKLFAREHGRAPLNQREITALITRKERESKASVAGYDLTFSAPKSFSILWAAATPAQREQLEAVHNAAVSEAFDWFEREIARTRIGKAGVRQVETRGLMATAFTHRDTRDGDPHLHTHVAISSKVQIAAGQAGSGDPERWLTLDGQAVYKANIPLSERYNRLLEAKSRDLGLLFVNRSDSGGDGKQVVREVAGITPDVITAMSSRRREIDARMAELTADFTEKYGRAPSNKEVYGLRHLAHGQTRKYKDEPRALVDQLATWQPQIETAMREAGVRLDGGAADVFAHAQRASEQVRARTEGQRVPTTPETVSDLAGQMITRITNKRATFDLGHIRAEAERTVRPFLLPEQAENTLVSDLVDAVCEHASATRIDARDPVQDIEELTRGRHEHVHATVLREVHHDRDPRRGGRSHRGREGERWGHSHRDRRDHGAAGTGRERAGTQRRSGPVGARDDHLGPQTSARAGTRRNREDHGDERADEGVDRRGRNRHRPGPVSGGREGLGLLDRHQRRHSRQACVAHPRWPRHPASVDEQHRREVDDHHRRGRDGRHPQPRDRRRIPHQPGRAGAPHR